MLAGHKIYYLYREPTQMNKSEHRKHIFSPSNLRFCATTEAKCTHQLVGVPVESRLLQHKPVLLPFHAQEAFAFFLPVQPALVIWLTQLFD